MAKGDIGYVSVSAEEEMKQVQQCNSEAVNIMYAVINVNNMSMSNTKCESSDQPPHTNASSSSIFLRQQESAKGVANDRLYVIINHILIQCGA